MRSGWSTFYSRLLQDRIIFLGTPIDEQIANLVVAELQVSGGFEAEVSDIEIQAREVLALGRRLEEIIAEHTGRPLAKVASDLERDSYMSSEEALAYGVIDRVIFAPLKLTLPRSSSAASNPGSAYEATSGTVAL